MLIAFLGSRPREEAGRAKSGDKGNSGQCEEQETQAGNELHRGIIDEARRHAPIDGDPQEHRPERTAHHLDVSGNESARRIHVGFMAPAAGKTALALGRASRTETTVAVLAAAYRLCFRM